MGTRVGVLRLLFSAVATPQHRQDRHSGHHLSGPFYHDLVDWPFLDETCKLASNAASVSFVLNMDGIVPLDEVDTLLNTWASFPEDDDEPPRCLMTKKMKSFTLRLQGR